MSYAQSQASAVAMLAKYGQPVTITSHEAGTYDPASATATITDVVVQTTGAIFPLSMGVRGFKYGIADEPGTVILASDQQLLLPGDIAQPKVNSTVTIGGVNYTLVAISPINPGGTAVLYDCVIRGAS